MFAQINTADGGVLIENPGPGHGITIIRYILSNVDDEDALVTFKTVTTVGDVEAITPFCTLSVPNDRKPQVIEFGSPIGDNVRVEVTAGSLAQGQIGGGLKVWAGVVYQLT